MLDQRLAFPVQLVSEIFDLILQSRFGQPQISGNFKELVLAFLLDIKHDFRFIQCGVYFLHLFSILSNQ